MLRKRVRKKLGHGTSIKLFIDPGLPHPNSSKVISRSNGKDEMLVLEFITLSYHWDILKLNQILCLKDVVIILSQPINSSSLEDPWIWHFSNNGQYNVKSGYKAYWEANT